MTILDLPRTAETTPESQDVEALRAMLDDKSLAGFHEEIRESIRRLTATSVLGA